MKSMTGYGKCTVTEADRQLTVEVKSVNNRYLEIVCRMPKALSFAEDSVKKIVKKHLSRGSVEVYVAYANKSNSRRVSLDEELAGSYVSLARTLGEKYGAKADIAAADLMRLPEVVTLEAEEEDEELITRLIEEATEGATLDLVKMRLVEGEALRSDLERIAGNIAEALGKAEARAPKVVEAYAEKLRARITELLGGVAVDEARLLNEVAFFADKADINEEMNRLHSHIAQFRAALSSSEPQGRNLDFVSQEMGREINTMGSKSNDTELTNLVIYMKNELEKIKEQIRNAE